MKIVYSTDQIYLHGGIEKVLAQKLNYLVTLPDYQVYLITTEQKGKPFCYPISDKVLHYDLDINYIRTKSYFSLTNLKKVPTHLKRLKNKLRAINPDVLIVCNYAFDFYFIPFISGHIKTIKEFHASRYYYVKHLPKASLFKKIMHRINTGIEKKYTHIVVLNNDEQKYYNPDNLVVIPNASTQVKLNTIKRKKIILAAGRIAPVKQFDHLIKAWGLIAAQFPDWEVHIYGEGDQDLVNELKNLIKKEETPSIKLMGATNKLDAKMQAASLYAMTSATECFPMVLLESLACGLPVVSYDCPYGPRNIITNEEDGILVKHNNIEAFSVALAQLIKNSEKRKLMEQAALKNIARFNEHKVMEKWLKLFKIKAQ
ncbi:glycosyltransferase family 4 protein [Lutibacter sp. A64]|uniref:glycosyltransferase family 4 protein n=1 Tax=Lutibacter sp. A64 TaxID=2918526 RepID=UPI001F052C33|nr:glycosyltransferase family 4 protein [Lutibacter sp. A64]UMB55463.1 glycosyltransferase family 4 protein [Lutibacter sp. A64]